MSTTFAELLPELVAPVECALREEGYVSQAESIAGTAIERWTYDPSVKAGYIYLVQGKPVQHGETPAAKTLVFMFDHGFNLDLRAHGELFGVELLEHENIFARLAADSAEQHQRCGLTTPSSGRLPAGFARLQPPLMSNVGWHSSRCEQFKRNSLVFVA